jgi:hypothetical protein
MRKERILPFGLQASTFKSDCAAAPRPRRQYARNPTLVPVARRAIVNAQAGAIMAEAALNPAGGAIFSRGRCLGLMNMEPVGHAGVKRADPVGAMGPAMRK